MSSIEPAINYDCNDLRKTAMAKEKKKTGAGATPLRTFDICLFRFIREFDLGTEIVFFDASSKP